MGKTLTIYLVKIRERQNSYYLFGQNIESQNSYYLFGWKSIHVFSKSNIEHPANKPQTQNPINHKTLRGCSNFLKTNLWFSKPVFGSIKIKFVICQNQISLIKSIFILTKPTFIYKYPIFVYNIHIYLEIWWFWHKVLILTQDPENPTFEGIFYIWRRYYF